jgi:hypothetical protein
METLALLLGGQARVKLMRLFLFNKENVYSLLQASSHAKVSEKESKREIAVLEKADLIKSKSIVTTRQIKRGSKMIEVKKKEIGWFLNVDFVYLSQLQALLTGSKLLKDEEIMKKLARAGKMKLVIVAGVFIQDWTSRVDMFIVGDNIKKGTLDNVIRGIEAEIGKELVYSFFDTADFKYRLSMCDKLVRDVLDYPHQKIHDKLGDGVLKK